MASRKRGREPDNEGEQEEKKRLKRGEIADVKRRLDRAVADISDLEYRLWEAGEDAELKEQIASEKVRASQLQEDKSKLERELSEILQPPPEYWKRVEGIAESAFAQEYQRVGGLDNVESLREKLEETGYKWKMKKAMIAPVVTLVQSSGWGKSRTTCELANLGVFVIYCSFASSGTAYPPRSAFADFFYTNAVKLLSSGSTLLSQSRFMLFCIDYFVSCIEALLHLTSGEDPMDAKKFLNDLMVGKNFWDVVQAKMEIGNEAREEFANRLDVDLKEKPGEKTNIWGIWESKVFKKYNTLEGLLSNVPAPAKGKLKVLEFTYGTLVHGHCLAGEFDEAKRLVAEFKDTGMSPGSLVVLHNLMLKGFSEAGLVDEAKSHLHQMDCKPNSVSYNTLIDALCSSGRIQEAREELQAMAKRGVAPNRVTYNAMATGLGKAGLLDEAFELMRVMESAGFALTAVTFNPVVEFLCKSGRPDEACKVMETMLLRNIEPNILTLNLILHAFCKAARPEEALGITDIMVEMGFCPTIVTFNALLELFCNTDQMDSAAELLETMARSKCKPNFVTYSIMVQKFAEMGRMVEARAFLEQLVVCGYAPNLLVCNAYVAGLCKTGEMDLASRFLTVMAEEGCRANTATYNSLVEGFCKLGRMDEAERVLEEMIAEGSLPDSTTYSVLIQGLCSAGQIEHAFMVMLQVTRAVESARPDPATFVKLIEKLCELGEMDRAALVLERMGDEHEEFRVCQVLISNSQH